MYKYEVGIEGMMCSMCEIHIADTIRKVVPGAGKVKASRRKKLASFQTKEPADLDAMKKGITDIGYTVTDVRTEEK
ncbi:MAG: heavy metal-associated domain-containing protein [Eubacteriales bacterium]|jgi:copper chaperone CopZ